jgi:hypothetical protein
MTHVEAWSRWLWEQGGDAWGYFSGGIGGGFRWLWRQGLDLRDRVMTHVEAWSRWLWEQGGDAAGAFAGGIGGGFHYVTNTLIPAIAGSAFDIVKGITDAFDEIRKALEKALEAIGDKLVDAIKWPWEHIPDHIVEIVDRKLAIPGKLFRHEYTDLHQLIDDALDPPVLPLGFVFAMVLVMLIFMSAYQSTWKAYAEPLFEGEMQLQRGSVGRELLSVGQLQEALNRGFIDRDMAMDHLHRAGYPPGARLALLDMRWNLPGPTDLIHMAVREVFNPQLREELTLDAEFPDAFGEWAEHLGISLPWARNYWADHWDLPSPSQGYEMLHRGLIEMPQLINLIKALDYAPVWRQHLIDIAYNPITRVDLRRLRKSGIISTAQVFDGYKALGYNDEKAGWLRDWTEKYYSPEDESQLDDMADLASSAFRTAYRRGVITREEALDKIIDAGYTEDVADFLLSIDDAQLALNPTTDAGVNIRDLTVPIIRTAYAEKLWDRARAQQELEALGYLAWEADLLLQLEDLAQQRELAGLQETVVKEQYLARTIDRAAASAQLDQLKVLPERRDLLLQRWDLQGAQKPRTLTVAQLQKAYEQGLKTDTELLNRLAGMGYNDEDAKTIVDLTDTTGAGMERRLSAAQLQKAYKLGIVSDAQLSEQLLTLGYSQADAKLLVQMAVPTPVEKALQLSVSVLQVALRSGLLTDAEFLARVTTLGYSQADVELLVKMAAPAPADKARQLSASQLQVGFRSGLVTEAELLEKLTALGYAQADAELLRDIAAQKPEPPPRRLAVANLKALFKAETIDKAGLLVELLALGYTDRDAGWIADLIAPEE